MQYAHARFAPGRRRVHLASLAIAVFGAIAAAWLLSAQWHAAAEQSAVRPVPVAAPEPTPLHAAVADNEPIVLAAKLGAAKQFTGQQFMDLYNSLAYPDLQPPGDAPIILGNPAADARIRQLVESRGYSLKQFALPPLVRVDGLELQAPAAQFWQELKAAALTDGIALKLVAAYRSVADQKSLFAEELIVRGASASSIAAGQSDGAVLGAVNRVTAPGYSRHHTGYTVDIGCATPPPGPFGSTPCFRWLSANNYAHAKAYGWIPSYPSGASKQGPLPEPWEYVWVGREHLFDK